MSDKKESLEQIISDDQKFTNQVMTVFDITGVAVPWIAALSYGGYKLVQHTPTVINNLGNYCSDCYQQIAPYIDAIFNS